jgi:hypothetical protein
MHFFFDAQISYQLCNMLAALEEGGLDRFVHITKHPAFAHNNNECGNSTPDDVWLRVLGNEAQRWIVLSGDSAILETPHERAALTRSGLTFFAFDARFQTVNIYEQALKLIKMWPQIKAKAIEDPPVLYKVAMGARPSISRI